MAFEKGGIVPGTGNFDSVHAMLTPGEAVIPKALTERLTRASDSGGGDVHHHHHYNPSFSINAVDGASVKNMLDKHSDHFERHFHSTLRKMNK
jgi:hypothetical protein